MLLQWLGDRMAWAGTCAPNRRRTRRLWLVPVLSSALLLGLAGCSPGPRVIASVPSGGTTGLLVDTAISLTFDRPMQAESIQPALAFSPSLERGFSVEASSDNKTFRVIPALPLRPDTRYTVTVGRTALDSGGKALRKAHTVELSTAKPRAVTCMAPRFSPDGSMLAWTEGEGTDEPWSVYVAPADGSGAPRRLQQDVWPNTEAVWHPLGQALIVVGGDGQHGSAKELYSVPLETGGVQLELPLSGQLTDPGRLTVAYSPSGSLLAVQNDMYLADAHSDYLRELGVAQADGTGMTKFGNLLVGWGPDDTWLVYLDMPGIGEGHNFNYDFYRYAVASGKATKLTGIGRITNFGRAARSGDGGWFAFDTWFAEEVSTPSGLDIQRLPRDIWVMDSGATRLTRLTRDDGHNTEPAFTGDGGIIFASDRSGDWDIWQMPDLSAPAVVANVTGRQGYDGQPQQSPVGDLVALVSDAGGGREVFTLGPAGWRQISGRPGTP